MASFNLKSINIDNKMKNNSIKLFSTINKFCFVAKFQLFELDCLKLENFLHHAFAIDRLREA